jgi:hypothetical protein
MSLTPLQRRGRWLLVLIIGVEIMLAIAAMLYLREVAGWGRGAVKLIGRFVIELVVVVGLWNGIKWIRIGSIVLFLALTAVGVVGSVVAPADFPQPWTALVASGFAWCAGALWYSPSVAAFMEYQRQRPA